MAESDSTSLVDQKGQWSNDKTIIELGYRKISWFASVWKIDLGPVVRSLVSDNRWLRDIKTYRFPWYLTLVSANHAFSNPGLLVNDKSQYFAQPRSIIIVYVTAPDYR